MSTEYSLNEILDILINKIWPSIDAGTSISPDVALTNGVTRWFIISTVFLFGIFILFCLGYAIYNKCNIIKQIKLLLKKAKTEDRNTEIKNLFEQNKYTKELSKAFIEYKGKLYLGQDVDYYINENSLDLSILCTRVLPLGAALLTGLGVLGTFVGLLLGLNGLHLDGNMANLQNEIRQVANGASVAFATSVVGVSCSLVLNLFEKFVAAWMARCVCSIQNDFVNLFPPVPAAEVFLDVQKNSRESANTLQYVRESSRVSAGALLEVRGSSHAAADALQDVQKSSRETADTLRDVQESSRDSADILGGLAEQIGSNMQKSLDSFMQAMFERMAESMSQSADKIASAIEKSLEDTLRNTLVPSIDRISSASQDLASRQLESSETALESVLEKFMERVGQAGDTQREAIQKTSDEFQQTIRSLSASMSEIMGQMKEQQDTLLARQQDQMDKLDSAFRNMSAEQGKNIEFAGQNMRAVLDEFRGQMEQEFARQTASLSGVTDSLHSSLSSMSESMDKFFRELESQQQNATQSQADMSQHMTEQAKGMFSELASSMRELMGQMKEQQDTLLARQQDQMDKLDSAFRNMSAEQGKNIEFAGQNMRAVLDDFRGQMEQEFARQTSSLGGVTDNLHSSLSSMSESMDQVFKTLETQQQSAAQTQAAMVQRMEQHANSVFDQHSSSMADMNELLRNHAESMQHILDQGRALQADINESKDSLSQLGESVESSCTKLAFAGASLESFSDDIRASMDKSAANVEKTTELYKSLETANRSTHDALKDILEELGDLENSLSEVAESASRSVDTASENYQQLADSWQELQGELREYVEEIGNTATEQVQELDRHMTELLKEYGQQVKAQVSERMSDWNAQTQEFCDTMTNAVSTISEVVDEIDGKVGNR